MTRGIVFIANGLEHQKECSLALWSLWQSGCHVPVHIISVGDIGHNETLAMRPNLYDLSPFDETLCLDTDIQINGSLSPLWELLEDKDFDIWIPVDPTGTWGTYLEQGWAALQAGKQLAEEKLPAEAIVYNPGIMLWRKGRESSLLFKLWRQEYDFYALGCDQPSLARAIHRGEVRIGCMPQQFNWPMETATIHHPFRLRVDQQICVISGLKPRPS